MVPEVISKLAKLGLEFLVERGAGSNAFLADSDYEKAGARLLPDARALCAEADIVVKVQRPTLEEAELLKEGSVVVSLLQVHTSLEIVSKLAARRITAFSMDLVPRITKAQEMDALSSMSTISGYKAVLLGAAALGKLLPMITSAAGTLRPARVFILGAGVAGLQAIATARRLGAVVQAFDIRPATKEQVQSLGATFVELDLSQAETEAASGYAKELSTDSQTRALETIRKNLKNVDIVISTALIPGKPAPRLITREMLSEMKLGSVIVDLAAEAGGNCEATEPGKEIVCGNVVILGPTNLAASVPTHASEMYSRNVASFLRYVVKEGSLKLDFEDPIVKDMCLTHQGEVRNEGARKLLAGA